MKITSIKSTAKGAKLYWKKVAGASGYVIYRSESKTGKYTKIKEIKKQMTSNQDIQEYYQSYYEINRLLDHVTQIIFKDISQILDTTGYKL